jgi:PIN domain nuclease of toxin-antitoxin system
MRLLLDTHIALWALSAVENLTDEGRALIADPSNQIFVSAVNVWEIAVKRPLHRADTPLISAEDAMAAFAAAGYTMLDITASHAAAVETLPTIHGDPFDRLLVAQAMTEPLRLLTHDKILARYSDTVICLG